MGSKRSFWVRLDSGGRLSDAFRVKFEAEEGTWRDALVDDLKEQLLLQHAEVLTSASPTGRLPPTPLLHIVLPSRPGAQEKEKVLSASDGLGTIPGGAGESDWHLLVRIVAVKAPSMSPQPTVPCCSDCHALPGAGRGTRWFMASCCCCYCTASIPRSCRVKHELRKWCTRQGPRHLRPACRLHAACLTGPWT